MDLRKYTSTPLYIPEMMTAERLLVEFRSRGASMAVVVDEYGGASGVVTPADVVTAVMGEMDSSDESDVVALPGGVYDVDGTTTLDEIEEHLKVHFASPTMRTVAGLLMERLGRMPRPGDRMFEAGFTFHVTDVDGPRVKQVRISREGGTKTRIAPPARPPERPSEKRPSPEPVR